MEDVTDRRLRITSLRCTLIVLQQLVNVVSLLCHICHVLSGFMTYLSAQLLNDLMMRAC